MCFVLPSEIFGMSYLSIEPRVRLFMEDCRGQPRVASGPESRGTISNPYSEWNGYPLADWPRHPVYREPESGGPSRCMFFISSSTQESELRSISGISKTWEMECVRCTTCWRKNISPRGTSLVVGYPFFPTRPRLLQKTTRLIHPGEL